MPRPDLSRVPEYYHKYIAHVKESDFKEALSNSTAAVLNLVENLPAVKSDYRYADDKWTIKEVLQHIIDAERVFSYRALRFARQDETPLPGFDQNQFASNAKADKRNWNDLVEEFKAVRKATEYLFASFDDEQLNASGIASDNPVYVLGIGFIIAGHCLHHLKVVQERYL